MVHTWGRNPNTTLGHDRSRGHLERLDLPLPRDTSVVQVSVVFRDPPDWVCSGMLCVCTVACGFFHSVHIYVHICVHIYWYV